jgi:uncharacterized protein YjiS (DUF1127 family)
MASQRISFDYVAVPQLESGLVRRLLTSFKRWREHSLQRAVLAELDARMLQDIGITQADVWRETRGLDRPV